MFIEKVPIRYAHGNAWQFWLFGKAIVQIQRKTGERRRIILFPFRTFDKQADKNSLIFYLKFNTQPYSGYGLWCLNHWINIATSVTKNEGGGYYIVCDKPLLIKHILKNIRFEDCEVKIIPSNKHTISRKQLVNICHPKFEKACLAHLTTFSHAKKYGIKEFWNIDADDTGYFLPPDQVARCLENVRKYARQNDIAVMSQDMHRSVHRGWHWSFGITYVNNVFDYKDCLRDSYQTAWKSKYKFIFDRYLSIPNLDWYFTYLHDTRKLKLGTFTIDNVYFGHWGMATTAEGLSLMLQISKHRKIMYPLFPEICNANTELCIDMFDDVIEFNSDSDIKESVDFMKNVVLARQRLLQKFSK